MNKILFISYTWPPRNSAGVYRVLNVCNFLVSQGFEVFVVTAEKYFSSAIDIELNRKVDPRISVIKVKNTPPFSIYCNSFRNSLFKVMGVCSEFIENKVFFPDNRTQWRKAAFKKSMELINQYNIKVVYTSSPPFSSAFVGLKLKQELGEHIKLITEFRDLISKLVRSGSYKTTRRKSFFEYNLLESSDLVIVDGPHKIKYLKEAHKLTSSLENKIHYVYSGYPSSMNGATVKNKTCHFPKIIRYVGGIRGLSIIPGFDSILIKCAQRYKDKIIFEFVGSVEKKFKAKLTTHNLSNIRFINHVPHYEAEKLTIDADALLLLINDIPYSYIMTSIKIFRYIASMNPIFAIIPSYGSAADIIRETKTGVIFDPGQRDWGENFINSVGQFCSGSDFQFNPDIEVIRKYCSENQFMHIKNLILSL